MNKMVVERLLKVAAVSVELSQRLPLEHRGQLGRG